MTDLVRKSRPKTPDQPSLCLSLHSRCAEAPADQTKHRELVRKNVETQALRQITIATRRVNIRTVFDTKRYIRNNSNKKVPRNDRIQGFPKISMDGNYAFSTTANGFYPGQRVVAVCGNQQKCNVECETQESAM